MRGSVAFNSMEACVEAAVAGLGVTQVLSSLAARAVQEKRLREVLAPFAAEGPSIYVVYPPRSGPSPRLELLVRFLTDVLSVAV